MSGRGVGVVRAGLLLAVVGLAWGCSSSRPPAAPAARLGDAFRPEDRSFLVSPLEGYPLEADPERLRRVETGYLTLATHGRLPEAQAAAQGLLAADPAFAPALVLAAEVEYQRGEFAAAVARLTPVAQELPRYTAALLVLGRSAEQLGDVPNAYAAYLSISGLAPVARERAEALAAPAFDAVSQSFEGALQQGRLDEAENQLRQLRAWGPERWETLDASRRLAELRGDHKAERLALEQLLARQPDRREFRERRAELDLEEGDSARGLQELRELAAEFPEDRALAEKVERAKFRWRLTLLPTHVQRIATKNELSRGDFAVLAYWLIPEVRYSRPAGARIAGDILDHPRREEIARVVNLGLMDVDSTLHTFGPDRAVEHATALRALLRGASALGGKTACLQTPGTSLCDQAARCGLVSGPCPSAGAVSGDEALEMIRRALLLFAAKG